MPLTDPPPHSPTYATFPLWLERSGLPESLHVVRKNAWSVFKKLVELDCRNHPAGPGLNEVVPTLVGNWTGFDPPVVLKICEGLRQKKMIRGYLPRHPDEAMLYEIAVPLQVPRDLGEIRQELAEELGPGCLEASWRYLEQGRLRPDQEGQKARITELYTQNIGFRMNATVLDQLEFLAARYDLPLLEKVFGKVGKFDKPRLTDIYKALGEQAPKK